MLDAFFTCKMWRHKTFRLTNCLILSRLWLLLHKVCRIMIAFIDHFRHKKKNCQPLNVTVLVLIWIIRYHIGKSIARVQNINLSFSSKIVYGKSHFNCVSYAIMVTIMNAFISLFKCNMPFWMLKCFYNLHVNALLHLMFVVGN